jgi:hypothetical protein
MTRDKVQIERRIVLAGRSYDRTKSNAAAHQGPITQHKEQSTSFTSNWTSPNFFEVPGRNHQICGRTDLAEQEIVQRQFLDHEIHEIHERGADELEPDTDQLPDGLAS